MSSEPFICFEIGVHRHFFPTSPNFSFPVHQTHSGIPPQKTIHSRILAQKSPQPPVETQIAQPNPQAHWNMRTRSPNQCEHAEVRVLKVYSHTVFTHKMPQAKISPGNGGKVLFFALNCQTRTPQTTPDQNFRPKFSHTRICAQKRTTREILAQS